MKPTSELIKLVDKSLERTITRVEMARLEELLEHDDYMLYYLEMTSVEGALPEALASFQSSSAKVTQFPRPAKWLKYAAAVAVFFVGVLSGKMFFSVSDEIEKDIVTISAEIGSESSASITSLIGVSWSGAAPSSIDLTSESETIAIESGLIELTFASGVRSLVEGPAEFNVTGDNAVTLNTGRLVADVPKGAEGFTVDYPDGKVVDLGTEFCIHVPENRLGAEVGVFRGEVEVYAHDETEPLKITENHAVMQYGESGSSYSSIPFEHDNYVRTLPSREFAWELPATPFVDASVMEFDVSHLVWKPGEYCAVIKWMRGQDALVIDKAELFLDGNSVAIDNHQGLSGFSRSKTYDNSYRFSIPEELHQKGKWVLKVTAHANDRRGAKLGTFTAESSGVLLFEDGATLAATDSSFVGAWEYSHDGRQHRRVFTADHKAKYFHNGLETAEYNLASWSVTDGILTLTVPLYNGTVIKELHLLSNNGELIFLNNRYRNALRVE